MYSVHQNIQGARRGRQTLSVYHAREYLRRSRSWSSLISSSPRTDCGKGLPSKVHPGVSYGVRRFVQGIIHAGQERYKGEATVGYSQRGIRHQSVNLEKLTDPTTTRPSVSVLKYLYRIFRFSESRSRCCSFILDVNHAGYLKHITQYSRAMESYCIRLIDMYVEAGAVVRNRYSIFSTLYQALQAR